ncbi:hypothetical protein GJ744_000558 [Endocarpon pusillum]|uniref:TLDc domain-containing protein n=1 Tax=Endocarpon pusillum TaxID=364733 RepID=A0A8H7AAL8_9EURO|nr:hypothetical protein GJ744_000558 [Endocarpon pusillum]
MGQSQSGEAPHPLSTEQLSHELALRFASKCFTHLEIAHYKDNFKALADHQDGVEYWKEETLGRFLLLPDALRVGSIVYQMATYLGAFPFPSLAPCILTREAMLKVVTIMTERYGKVLKRGKRDRVRLLFRSMAVFDRTRALSLTAEKPTMEQLVAEQKPDDMMEGEAAIKEARSGVAGFAIDEPVNDDLDEEEDDDELALAALDSLDAIEVFKEDQKATREKKIHHAQIPVENFRRFLMLLLVLAPLRPQENMAKYGEDLSEAKLRELESEAECILAAFDPDEATGGIRYTAFTQAISASFPFLFDPLNALFEHFLFSKNINLSKHRISSISTPPPPLSPKINPIASDSSDQSCMLTSELVSHLSTFLVTKPVTTSPVNLFHTGTRFHPVYSTTAHGTSLTSFSRQVMSWQSATLLLVTGTPTPASNTSDFSRPITVGAFLPSPWSKSSSSSSGDSSSPQPLLFLLSPRHALCPHNPYNHSSTSNSHCSPKTGIAIGCIIPPASRTSAVSQLPVLGPVSLRIDVDISTAIFQHDAGEGIGAFLPDPGLEKAQAEPNARGGAVGRKVEFDIDTLEIWGITNPEAGEEGEDEVMKQKKRLDWEEAEAARRAGVNFGGDKDGARALLEMAGLVGDKGRSGGSV